MAAAFIKAENRTFVQTVGFTFVQRNGLELAGFAHAVEDRYDFGIDMPCRRMRHHLETFAFVSHFQQEIAFADFGYRFFHHHRLGCLSRHFRQRVDTGVVFAFLQVLLIFIAGGFQSAVGVGKGADDAAEYDFLAEIFMRIGVGDVFGGAVNQITAGFGNAVGVYALAFAVHQAVVGAFDKFGGVLRFHLVDDLRMLHKHAVEVDIDGLDTVAGRGFAYARMQFDNGNAV